jgi:structural maintenance of chromosome 3 (chondroitin sulfate proteoglycan 6)
VSASPERTPKLISHQIVETDGEIDSINQSLAANGARLDELQTQQLQNSRGILQAQKTAERYIVKRQTLTNRQEECNKSIRDLGVLPEEAYKKYTDARNKAEQVNSYETLKIEACLPSNR